MSHWTNYPFLRIILTFVLGIFIARHTHSEAILHASLLGAVGIFLFALLGKSIFKKLPHAIWGNLLLAAVCLLGAYRYTSSNLEYQSHLIKTAWTNCQVSIGTITSFPIEKEKHIIHQVTLSTGLQDSTTIHTKALLLLYEKKAPYHTSTLNYGDKIRITGTPTAISSAKNPHEFDYSRYMAEQDIYIQLFAEPDQIERLAQHQANGLMSAIYRIRDYFNTLITTQIHGKNEQAIVSALLLGIKGQLDPEIKSAYAAAGAMHVLAVSGLHVSIIYFILTWAFKTIPAGDFKRLIVPTISIIALWAFALLTGFSPSILRAVSMFSIIIFAKILDRKSHIFNSLAFSAFILLLYDPSFLFDIGFQLSFLAVAGIVYLYPRCYQHITIPTWIGNKIWQLTCVSVAAQIATFPLSLYYFHQFPSYFLLTNLFVIPAAYGVMILGITMLIFGSLTNWIGWLLEQLVYYLNIFVSWVQQTDSSVIDWIHLSESQTLFIYIAMAGCIALFHFKKTSYLWLTCLAVVGFSIDQTHQVISQSNNHKMVFYAINHSRTMDQINRFNAQLYTLDSLLSQEKINYHIAPYRIHHLLPPPNSIKKINTLLTDFALLQTFNNTKVLFLTKPFDPNEIQLRLKADIVVVSNQSIDSLRILDQIVDCQQVILDNTNSHKYTSRIKKEANQLDMDVIDLNQQAHMISLSGNKKFLDMLF
ncbi:competence protein ComEC family protein [Reichenbachiella carrageenanivorans]|uniref:Competence protein ComEC family protein n=1 Tax=Reichenbachiella carrageenanivorans TaxID=2979869 RepID=A0ABY6CV63_9BACT|nr:ComEC/Rec2 family competence protein [Reichenbachiella carrageenanivorans]UXX77816.1 competence protein ComEC family protein [Reichenbachiella carrageenanivorans]